MYEKLSNEEQALVDYMIEDINTHLCSGERSFNISSGMPHDMQTTQVRECVMNAFKAERWKVLYDHRSEYLIFSSNIPRQSDNKPADFKTGMRPVSNSEE